VLDRAAVVVVRPASVAAPHTRIDRRARPGAAHLDLVEPHAAERRDVSPVAARVRVDLAGHLGRHVGAGVLDRITLPVIDRHRAGEALLARHRARRGRDGRRRIERLAGARAPEQGQDAGVGRIEVLGVLQDRERPLVVGPAQEHLTEQPEAGRMVLVRLDDLEQLRL